MERKRYRVLCEFTAHSQKDPFRPRDDQVTLRLGPPLEIWADPDVPGDFVPFTFEGRPVVYEIDRATFVASTERVHASPSPRP
jgi:hypothetical protein